MIIEVLTTILFFITATFVCLGYGKLFANLFSKKIKISLGEIGIYGLFFLGFLSILLHFFFPINYFVTSFICLFGLYYFVAEKINLFLIEKKNFLIFIFLIPTLILFEYHADYFWYHLPYVNITSENKIIFGLANLNDNLGYGHLWYDIITLFNLPIIQTKYLSIVSIVFLFFFLIYLKDEYLFHKKNIVRIFILFSACLILLIYKNSKDYGSEIQVNLIYIICSLKIILFYNIENKVEKEFLIISIIILFFFSILIRTNSIIFFPLIFLFLVLNIKSLLNITKTKKLLIFFLICFTLIYLVKNLIISGCLSYPVYNTCFDFVDWGIGYEQAKLKFYHLSAQSKGYLVWLKNQNYISDNFDFYIYRDNLNFISPEKYINEENWIKHWWLYEYDVDRFLNIIYFFLLTYLITFVFSVKYGFKKKSILKKKFFFLILFMLPIFSWLLLLPQTRYGGYGIIFSFFCMLTIILLEKFKRINFLPIYIIISLAFLNFEYKNIERILANFDLLNQDLNENFFEYPFMETNKIIINKNFNLEVTELNFGQKERFGEPLYCYDTKGLCSSTIRIKCINNIEIKNSFIYITPDKDKCSNLIDKFLWY